MPASKLTCKDGKMSCGTGLLFFKDGMVQLDYTSYIFIAIVAISVCWLLFGGMQKIGAAADIMVPIMGVLYIVSCIAIILKYYHNIPNALNLVYIGLFDFKAGAITTITVALTRVLNTTDTGAGFSAISQSNSNVKLAGQQGLVSFFDPFIVAIIMSIGAFAILVVGVPYQESQFMGLLAIKALFISLNPHFEYMLILIAFMFGFTTIMALGFYVEQCFIYLFGKKFRKIYILLYIVWYSSASFRDIEEIVKILDISYCIGVLINIVAIGLLSNKVKEAWDEYINRKH